jgi:hypothetical protein
LSGRMANPPAIEAVDHRAPTMLGSVRKMSLKCLSPFTEIAA